MGSPGDGDKGREKLVIGEVRSPSRDISMAIRAIGFEIIRSYPGGSKGLLRHVGLNPTACVPPMVMQLEVTKII